MAQSTSTANPVNQTHTNHLHSQLARPSHHTQHMLLSIHH